MDHQNSIDEMEQLMLSQVEVSDSVIDRAKAELLAVQASKTKARSSNSRKRIFIASLTAAALCAIVVPTALSLKPIRATVSPEPYRMEELQTTSMLVSEYSQQTQQDYVSAAGASDGLLYSDGETDILLMESFTVSGFTGNWYVLLNGEVEDLLGYTELYQRTEVNGKAVYYEEGQSIRASVHIDHVQYYVSIEDGTLEELILFLQKTI